MNLRRVLPAADIAEVAERLAAVRWSWSEIDVAGIADALGWTVAGTGPGGGLLQTGYAPGAGYADVLVSAGATAAVVVLVTDGVRSDSPEATGFRRDVFAAAVAAVSGVLGPPDRRIPGPLPECRWVAASGTLRVSQDEISVAVALLSPAYAMSLDAPDPAWDDLEADVDGTEW